MSTTDEARPLAGAAEPAIDRWSELKVAAICASLVALGPVGLMTYTPALPLLEGELGASNLVVQATVVVYFAGFALMQLVCGPLSDGFGRRRVCVAFVSLFTVAALASFFVTSIEWLLALRLVQGIGAAVGASVSRAIVRDAYSGIQAARILNLMALILAVGPALAPPVGGVLIDLVGWRSVFVFMALFAGLLLAAIWFWLPETNAGAHPSRARPAQVARNYAIIITDQRFLVPTLVCCLVIGAFYATASAVPYILIGLVGLTPSQFGLLTLVQSAAFASGSWLAGRLVHRMPQTRLVPYGMTLMWVGAAVQFVGLIVYGPSVWVMVLPQCLSGFAISLILPVFWSEPLAPFGHIAGSASALFGFMQYALGFVGAGIVSAIPDPVTAFLVVQPPMMTASFLLYLFVWRRMRRPPEAAPRVSEA